MSVTSDRATIKRDMWAVNASMSPVCTAVSLILLLIGEVRNSNGQYRDDENTSLQTLLSSVNNNKHYSVDRIPKFFPRFFIQLFILKCFVFLCLKRKMSYFFVALIFSLLTKMSTRNVAPWRSWKLFSNLPLVLLAEMIIFPFYSCFFEV